MITVEQRIVPNLQKISGANFGTVPGIPVP
jgi:hypothetical protein